MFTFQILERYGIAVTLNWDMQSLETELLTLSI